MRDWVITGRENYRLLRPIAVVDGKAYAVCGLFMNTEAKPIERPTESEFILNEPVVLCGIVTRNKRRIYLDPHSDPKRHYYRKSGRLVLVGDPAPELALRSDEDRPF